MKRRAIPTGIKSEQYAVGVHFRLEPPDEEWGEYIIESRMAGECMLFQADEEALGVDGLLTPCVEGTVELLGYERENLEPSLPARLL